MKRRIVSIMTCLLMAIAFMPVSAFAAQYNYAAVGDASTAGYGMADQVGYPKVVGGTYPALIGNVLKNNGYTGNVSQLAMSNMRVEDFRAMIDDSYDGDQYTKDKFPNLKNDRESFKDSIKKANLITFNLGTVNIGKYFFYVAGDPQNRCDDAEICGIVDADEQSTEGITESFNKQVDSVISDINNLGIPGMTDVRSTINSLIDINEYIAATAYVYYSFQKSCEAAIEKIRELNPNAKIVILGLGNMLKDLKLTVKYNSKTAVIDIGSIYGTQLVERANNALKETAAKKGAEFDETAGEVERFLDETRNYNGNLNSISSQFKRYCDVLEDDLKGLNTEVTNYVKGKGYKGSNATNRISWGMKGVYHTAATCLQNVAEITKVDLDNSDLSSLLDEQTRDKIPGMGKDSMTKLRAQCFTNGKLFADSTTYAQWSNPSGFINGQFYGTPRKIGNIVMAVGMHSQMGDGFFVHPSAKGHVQLKDKIMSIIHSSGLHNYDGWKVTKSADVGIVGTKTMECSVCHTKKTVSIPALNPAGTSLSKLTKGKKSFTAKWKKPAAANLKKITGYELRYSLKSSMAGAKTVRIANKNTVSKKIKKLKAKKKYYVQIRTYRKTNKNYYSGWSAKKVVKVK